VLESEAVTDMKISPRQLLWMIVVPTVVVLMVLALRGS
jgi:hypothetical protein